MTPNARQVLDAAQSEKSLQAQVIELLQLFDWRYYHTWRSTHSPAGYPDLTCVRPPRLIFAELKAEKGRLTGAQDEWLGDLGLVPGIEVYLWRPSDLDRIVEILR